MSATTTDARARSDAAARSLVTALAVAGTLVGWVVLARPTVAPPPAPQLDAVEPAIATPVDTPAIATPVDTVTGASP